METPLMHETTLVGLDGSNLLAYLAAIGTLRVLTLSDRAANVRMSWIESAYWTPVIHHSGITSDDDLIAALATGVCGETTACPAWTIGDDLNLSLADFAGHLHQSAVEASPLNRNAADFLAAFGSEAFGSGPKREQMSDTAFRTMSGAGHQHFLGFMRELAARTEAEHVARALLTFWDYGDDRPSLRWDPSDYRPHALRDRDPSTDPIRTMRGANRLAIEALPLFPTLPQAGRVRTVAFQEGNETEIAWPVWTDRLRLPAVASLLASEEIQEADRSTTASRCIAQVFRARRFTEGKYRNFTPARPVL
jgi:hypothetical protein